MSTVIAPSSNSEKFTCPSCHAIAHQRWFKAGLLDSYGNINAAAGYYISQCVHCDCPAFWRRETLVYPSTESVYKPSEYLPENVKDIYNEAADIASRSPKAAAALLRLALEHMIIELSGSAGSLDKSIQKLLKSGEDPHVIEMMNFCRIAGNCGVHIKEVSLDDTPEIAHALFELINWIAEETLGKKARFEKAKGLLPERERNKIEQRTPAQ